MQDKVRIGGTCNETLEDFRGWLDLAEWYGLVKFDQLQLTSQRARAD